MRFRLVPAGVFQMGSGEGGSRDAADTTPHEVQHPIAYYLQESEVSNAQFRAFDPRHAGRPDDAPAVLDRAQALAFAAWLAEREGDWAYRLPTEAEWEHAARAGEEGRDGRDENAWGLRGLRSGPWEWCLDRYGPYPSWAVDSPTGPQEGDEFVLRGGGGADPAPVTARRHVRADARPPDAGLRLATPIGYGLGRRGSCEVTFRLVDPVDGTPVPKRDAPFHLRVIRMQDRLGARVLGKDPEWARVPRPGTPVALRMVPGKYYVYCESVQDEQRRGIEIKFHVHAPHLDVDVPLPDPDPRRYGSSKPH